MIPNIIHCCWFSGEALPPKLQLCRQSWEVREPSMLIKVWNADMLDEIPNKPEWVVQALQQRKWAFVADYVRQYAVYTYGGWYLDSDVFILHQDFMEKFSDCSFVSCPEDARSFYNGPTPEIDGYTFGVGVQAACFGGEPGNKMCRSVLDIYDGFGDYLAVLESRDDRYYPIAPQIMEKAGVQLGVFRRNDLGSYTTIVGGNAYKFVGNLCVNGGISSVDITGEKPYAIHLCLGSWRKMSSKW